MSVYAWNNVVMGDFFWELRQVLRSRKMLAFLIFLGISIAVIIVLVRRYRRRRAIRRERNQPHNVIREVSQNVSSLTRQCYQIGNAYSTHNIHALNHANSPIWENVQEELVKQLKEGVPKMHDAVNRAQKGPYMGEAVIDYVGATLALERQLGVCSGCKERQGSSRTFYCALANPKDTGRLDDNGNIRLSQHLH